MEQVEWNSIISDLSSLRTDINFMIAENPNNRMVWNMLNKLDAVMMDVNRNISKQEKIKSSMQDLIGSL